MIAALLPAFYGALAYCIPAELLHRRKLRRQIATTKLLLEQARKTISEQAVDKMALLGRLDEAQAEVVALRAELIEFYDRAVVSA